ncbi:MAG: MFS transporter [Planctomycetota bacterium]
MASRFAAKLPFFYGYVMLPLAMLMQIGTSPGQTFAVSAFTPALLSSLDLSESRLALAYMIGTLLAALPLSLVGPLTDRAGLKIVSLTVIAGLAGTCFLASQVRGFWSLLGVFFLLRFLGQGSLTLIAGNTVAMWFRNRIGRMSAFISIGTALTFAWVPEALSISIGDIGWRATYQALAVILAAALLPAVLIFFCNRPEDLGQSVDGMPSEPVRDQGTSEPADASDHGAKVEMSFTLRQAFSTASYSIVGLTNAVWAMIGTGVVFYLFTLCQDRGFAEGTAADLFKTFGLSMLAMQFLGGLLTDFWPLNRLLGLGASMLSVALVALWAGESPHAMHAFALLFGGGQGLLIAVTGAIYVRFYGRAHLGSIRGTVWCLTVAGSGCGPLIMGAVKDASGSYDFAVLIFLLIMTPLSIASWWVAPPKMRMP